MKPNNQLITLAIPTFNRGNYLDSQLTWAVASIGENWDKIELIVCDNASTDNTAEICAKWKQRLGSKLKVFRNSENVGLVRNCLLSIERATAKYVWAIGDDDPIKKSAVGQVLDILEKHTNIHLLHINHRCIDGRNGDVITQAFYQVSENLNSIKPSAILLSKILQDTHTGGFMFITANVMNREAALSFVKSNPPVEDTLLAYPLYLNLGLAAEGAFYLIASCLIDCVYHQSSWSDKYFHVNYIEVPKTLLLLSRKGISKEAIRVCLNHQFAGLISYRDMFYMIRKNYKLISTPFFFDWWKLAKLKTCFECKLALQ
jgi:glycosyltransferase involved in cell wall biosynthesis